MQSKTGIWGYGAVPGVFSGNQLKRLFSPPWEIPREILLTSGRGVTPGQLVLVTYFDLSYFAICQNSEEPERGKKWGF